MCVGAPRQYASNIRPNLTDTSGFSISALKRQAKKPSRIATIIIHSINQHSLTSLENKFHFGWLTLSANYHMRFTISSQVKYFYFFHAIKARQVIRGKSQWEWLQIWTSTETSSPKKPKQFMSKMLIFKSSSK